MAEPVSEEVARSRWMAIQAVRMTGVAMVVTGILIVNRVIDASDVVGYVLLAAGVVDIFLVPRLLARKWRTPPQ